jgi:2-polyprenyl-3-methyl-5-hydroxy-6-metoxy-1,4-benzoquinol methylase
MRCYLCGCAESARVEGKVRDRPEIGIRRCIQCGLVFLESFDHIRDDYYSATYTDEQLAGRSWQDYLDECRMDDERRVGQIKAKIAGHRYLDIGCGAGGVLLGARPHCREATGVEPQARWRRELERAGIGMRASLAEVEAASQDLISLFHVVEHVADPVPFLCEVAGKAARGGLVVIEVPNADDALLSLYRNDAFSRFTYWSPHLFLYNPHTLRMLLDKAAVFGEIEITQFQRYPLSNHLMWLARGVPGGHNEWSFLDTPEINVGYADRLAARGACDTLIAYARVKK